MRKLSYVLGSVLLIVPAVVAAAVQPAAAAPDAAAPSTPSKVPTLLRDSAKLAAAAAKAKTSLASPMARTGT